jgi:hypothetical protein
MVSTSYPTSSETRQFTRGTATARAVRATAETKSGKPARSFLAALLRSLSAFVA